MAEAVSTEAGTTVAGEIIGGMGLACSIEIPA